jgi:hypothetical protein
MGLHKTATNYPLSYAANGRLADVAPLAEAVWRYRIEPWLGKEDEMPTLSFILSPISVCLAGYIAMVSPISHLVQEFPRVLHHAIYLKYDELIDILLREDIVDWSIQLVMGLGGGQVWRKPPT